jgi:hypothetical protein
MRKGLSRFTFSSILVLIIMMVPSAVLYACPRDITPPSLINLTVLPGTINVATGPQTVVLTFHITDDLSGFCTGSFSLSSPSGQNTCRIIDAASLISGDSKDGIYEITLTFPQSSETGLWSISAMQLKDEANNIRHPDTSLLSGIQVISVMPDTTPPSLTGFDVVPDHINVFSGAQTVTCTLHIIDDMSGFNSGSLTLTSTSGDQSMSATIGANLLKSGSANDGIYELVLTFPQTSETGLWHVSSLQLMDKANNTVNSDTSSLKGILVASESPDKNPPMLASFDVAPYLVNVYTGAQTVTCTLHITDDLSGFSSGSLTWSSPSGNQTMSKTIDASRLKSGNANDGIYEYVLTFPQTSETGLWRVTAMELKDAADNKRNPNLNALMGIQVNSLASDTTPPSLVRLQALTAKVNVYTGPKPGILALYITDDMSGFSSGSLTLTSPSGNQTVSGSIDVAQLMSGNKNAGVYKVTVTFPQSSESGIWHVTSMQLKDEADNSGNPDVSGLEGIEIKSEKDIYILNVSVIGSHGSVKPTYTEYNPLYGNTDPYRVQIEAYPDSGYQVKQWTGTDDDSIKTVWQGATLCPNDRTVTVEFEPVLNPEDNDKNNNNDSTNGCFMVISGSYSSPAQSVLFLVFMVIVLMNILHSCRSFRKRNE